jgi:hypothetical protein
MSETDVQLAGELIFTEEQRNFLTFLFRKCRAKLTAEVKKSQRESCSSIFNLLNLILFDTCSDIVQKSDKPKSCFDKVLACGGKDGTEFAETLNEMQERQLLETMMKQAEEEVSKITTDPQLEMKKFIDELFEVLNKFAENTGEAEAGEKGEKEATEDAALDQPE